MFLAHWANCDKKALAQRIALLAPGYQTAPLLNPAFAFVSHLGTIPKRILLNYYVNQSALVGQIPDNSTSSVGNDWGQMADVSPVKHP